MPRIARNITLFKKRDIKNLFKQSHTILNTAGLTIRSRPSSQKYGRALIVTPKKVGSAPVRNRIKRRIKSLFYEYKLYDLKKDFIFLCKKPLSHLSFDDLKKLILNSVA
jgi:ribonuclease P protein component